MYVCMYIYIYIWMSFLRDIYIYIHTYNRYIIPLYLVGGIPTPLKKLKVIKVHGSSGSSHHQSDRTSWIPTMWGPLVISWFITLITGTYGRYIYS